MNTHIYPLWDSTNYSEISDIELVFMLEMMRDKQYINIASDEADSGEIKIIELLDA